MAAKKVEISGLNSTIKFLDGTDVQLPKLRVTNEAEKKQLFSLTVKDALLRACILPIPPSLTKEGTLAPNDIDAEERFQRYRVAMKISEAQDKVLLEPELAEALKIWVGRLYEKVDPSGTEIIGYLFTYNLK